MFGQHLTLLVFIHPMFFFHFWRGMYGQDDEV